MVCGGTCFALSRKCSFHSNLNSSYMRNRSERLPRTRPRRPPALGRRCLRGKFFVWQPSRGLGGCGLLPRHTHRLALPWPRDCSVLTWTSPDFLLASQLGNSTGYRLPRQVANSPEYTRSPCTVSAARARESEQGDSDEPSSSSKKRRGQQSGSSAHRRTGKFVLSSLLILIAAMALSGCGGGGVSAGDPFVPSSLATISVLPATQPSRLVPPSNYSRSRKIRTAKSCRE